MKAMILAAGRGSRLKPLTDKIPKPLVKVGHCSLIEHHIKKCAAAGFDSIIINTAHLGDKLRNHLGDGNAFNIPLIYSDEGDQALETAGGISYALPLLGNEPFLAVSSDIYCDIPFDKNFEFKDSRLHLFMVNNPDHNLTGDFTPSDINLSHGDQKSYTYSGIAYIDPNLFKHEKRVFPLLEIIRQCIDEKCISSELHTGVWFDVGTASRLHEANKHALQKC